MTVLDLETFRATPLNRDPYEYLVIPGFVKPDALREINGDYPKIDHSGSFPLDSLKFGAGFQKLVDALESEEFRKAFEEKFGIDLTNRPTTITVRGRCGSSDGKNSQRLDEQDHYRADLHESCLGQFGRAVAAAPVQGQHRRCGAGSAAFRRDPGDVPPLGSLVAWTFALHRRAPCDSIQLGDG